MKYIAALVFALLVVFCAAEEQTRDKRGVIAYTAPYVAAPYTAPVVAASPYYAAAYPYAAYSAYSAYPYAYPYYLR